MHSWQPFTLVGTLAVIFVHFLVKKIILRYFHHLSIIEYFLLNIKYLRNSINFEAWKIFDLEHEKWPITGVDHGP